MKLRRFSAAAMAVTTGALGLTLVNASPALAAAGVWRPFGDTNPITSTSDTSKWTCGGTSTIDFQVYAQACVIRSRTSPGALQGAVIVRNSNPYGYTAEAAVELDWEGGSTAWDRWECSRSGLARESWSVCFGKTVYSSAYYNAVGGVNGVKLHVSPAA